MTIRKMVYCDSECGTSEALKQNDSLPAGWITIVIDGNRGDRQLDLTLCEKCAEKLKDFLSGSRDRLKEATPAGEDCRITRSR